MILIIYLDFFDISFEKYNYKEPQPFIKIFGKNIIEWILDYLNLKIYNYIILISNNELLNKSFLNLDKYNNIHFFLNNFNNSSNVIDSVLGIIKDINNDETILYIDTKNFYIKDISLLSRENTIFYSDDENEGHDKNKNNKNIYIDNNITNLLSKKNISKKLIIGSFIFKSLLEFKKYCNKLSNLNKILFMNNNISIINLINLMINDNIIFNRYKLLNNDDIISLETPLNIRLFCNNFPKINAINNDIMILKKKICFDLNCVLEINNNLYIPNINNINFIKYLKNIGNIIIITTNIIDKENNKNNLIEIMKQNDIIFDEIYFDKPDADFYIDYKNILLDNNIEKNLGFYKNKIESRYFNDVIYKDLKTYKKISEDLSGEIYYYNNIPLEIKDIFPIMFCFDKNNKWYEMENINSIPISKLYLNEELTLQQFDHILKTINRIHSCKIEIINNENINIYENYINKITNRYNNYDYSNFENSKNIYDILLKKLNYYQKKKLGKFSVIHGDTVFTNILINNFGKIKLIDMRGIIDKTLTIYGDKMYDYAKIYQSLLGYDEILENKYISIEFKNKFLNYFEEKFKNIYSDIDFYYLKIITASLLFTLIPLHNNDKCKYYYELIYKLNIL
jgi:hypothetical protein